MGTFPSWDLAVQRLSGASEGLCSQALCCAGPPGPCSLSSHPVSCVTGGEDFRKQIKQPCLLWI